MGLGGSVDVKNFMILPVAPPFKRVVFLVVYYNCTVHSTCYQFDLLLFRSGVLVEIGAVFESRMLVECGAVVERLVF